MTGAVQEAVDTLLVIEACDYDRVRGAISGTLNISEEMYQRRLRELEFVSGTSVHLPAGTSRKRSLLSASMGLTHSVIAVLLILVSSAVVYENYQLIEWEMNQHDSFHGILGGRQFTFDSDRYEDTDDTALQEGLWQPRSRKAC